MAVCPHEKLITKPGTGITLGACFTFIVVYMILLLTTGIGIFLFLDFLWRLMS